MPTTWQELAAEKKRRQAASIPQGWLITPPPDDVLDVTDIPAKCGLLSTRELEITNVGKLSVLLNRLATGEWSSVQVTTAFCKRAVIAQQLVCPSEFLPS
jgi:amidase